MSEVANIFNYSCGAIYATDGTETYKVSFGQYDVTPQTMKLQIVVRNNSSIVLNHVYDVTTAGVAVNLDDSGVNLKGNIQSSNQGTFIAYEFVGALTIQSKSLISFEREIVVLTQA